MGLVNVFASEGQYQSGFGQVVARVQYNSALDRWNGSNWQNGGVGQHLGITKLRDGRHVLIHGTQWQGCRDYAVVVQDREALDAVLQAGREDLLESAKYASLKALADKVLVPEHA